jgi:hypothetical protein
VTVTRHIEKISNSGALRYVEFLRQIFSDRRRTKGHLLDAPQKTFCKPKLRYYKEVGEKIIP